MLVDTFTAGVSQWFLPSTRRFFSQKTRKRIFLVSRCFQRLRSHTHTHPHAQISKFSPCSIQGGAIAILTACERPSEFAGVVLIAPLVQMNPESATPFKVRLLASSAELDFLHSYSSKWFQLFLIERSACQTAKHCPAGVKL